MIKSIHPILTHLHIDYINSAKNRVLHAVTHIFPLLGALSPQFGIPSRLVTDLSQLKKSFSSSLIKSTLSGISAYALFFAPSYFKCTEAIRSLFIHTKDFCLAAQAAYNTDNTAQDIRTNHSLKALQSLTHAIIDVINILSLQSNHQKLEFVSHLLQFGVGLVDLKKEYEDKSYLGIASQLGLNLLRLSNLAHASYHIYNIDQASSLSPTLDKEPTSTHPEIQGLDQFKFLKYLGEEGLSGDLFLVQDNTGATCVLKRLFSEEEKMEKSAAYKFMRAFGTVLFSPFSVFLQAFGPSLRTLNAEHALKISQVGDSNILKVFKHLKIADQTYIVLEHFEGLPLKGSSLKNLDFVQKITDTFTNVANKIDYFYKSSSLEDIKIADDTLKFTNHSLFGKADNWISCLQIYESLHNFFINLIQLLSNKSQLTAKLSTIFNRQLLITQYRNRFNDEEKSDIEEKCKNTFNIDLLKSVLNQIRDLFKTPQ